MEKTGNQPAKSPSKSAMDKRYNTGHKTLTSMESKALAEMLNHEAQKRDNFIKRQASIVRPRNPLSGDLTPRNINGDVVMNPNALHTVINGTLLFDPNFRPHTAAPLHKDPIGKIGTNDEIYRATLGNRSSDFRSNPAQPEDLYLRTQQEMKRNQEIFHNREVATQAKMKIHAYRHEKLLISEISSLRKELEAKERELEILRQNYKL